MNTPSERRVVLQEEMRGKDSLKLRATLCPNGDLVIAGLDSGPGIAATRGFDEYEWDLTVRSQHVSRLHEALGGGAGGDVLAALAAAYARDPACATKAFLEKAGVPVEFWSRKGD